MDSFADSVMGTLRKLRMSLMTDDVSIELILCVNFSRHLPPQQLDTLE